jgi:hypothetical protein
MHPSPIPCAQCGVNFMRHNLDPEIPKLCNTCDYRTNINKQKGEIPMSTIKMNVEFDQKISAQIEEICINEGITISEYFLRMHLLNIYKDEMKEFAEGISHNLPAKDKDEAKFAENLQKTHQKKGKK